MGKIGNKKRTKSLLSVTEYISSNICVIGVPEERRNVLVQIYICIYKWSLLKFSERHKFANLTGSESPIQDKLKNNNKQLCPDTS